MRDIIEHLRNPYSALEQAWRVLKGKGILVLATPNSASLLRFLSNLLLPNTEPSDLHIVTYSTVQLIRTLKYVGFQTADINGNPQIAQDICYCRIEVI